MKWITPAFVAFGCGSTVEAGGDPGRETGPCIEYQCLGGQLVCLSDLCVDPNAVTGPSTEDPSVSSDPTADSSGGGGVPNSNQVDILFVIDNSGSMGEEQGLIASNISSFFNVLEGAGADWRVGVTTTDNGNPWCSTTSPESGKLQLSSCLGRTGEFVFNGNPPADATGPACTDRCQFDTISTVPTTTELDDESKSRPWIESSGGTTNLAAVGGIVPTPVEAFQCFAPQGIAGCGFEQHLESMYKALLRSDMDAESQYGFLRSSAMLVVIIISDEVDCSYNNEHQSIFSTESMGGDPSVFWSDPTASAPTSAVCWRAGIECTGGPGTYNECHAANKSESGAVDVSDAEAVLHPISRYAEYLQGIEDLRKDTMPAQEVMVALIAGVPPGYDSGASEIMYVDATSPFEQNDYGIGAGCVNNATTPPAVARPPVREREVAEAFAIEGGRDLYSICNDDYSQALGTIAERIVARFGQ
ncbi:MAG TPA: hypothetical protein VG755_40020 [Nannocystaceae bacterium]|nr:hypothetical protein [Nannocystaceae bacterium]